MPIPDTMKAVIAAEPGGPEVLRIVTRPVPPVDHHEVLIKVAAAGLNGADLSQRRGRYRIPPGTPDILGLEASGEIAAIGAGVTQWRVGDKVAALLIGGGYAEYCAVPAVQCLPAPPRLTLVDAAALPECAMTVWSNVFELGALKPGDALLVHGGASGIGTTAIQLGHALGATRLTPPPARAKNAAAARRWARCARINYREEDFIAVIARETEGAGVDVVLDMVGGDYLNRDLAFHGAWRQAGDDRLQAGQHGRDRLRAGADKEAKLTGSRLRPRPVAEKGRLVAAVRKAVWPLIDGGRFTPVIDATFPLAEVARAHERMEAGVHIGKILLTM